MHSTSDCATDAGRRNARRDPSLRSGRLNEVKRGRKPLYLSKSTEVSPTRGLGRVHAGRSRLPECRNKLRWCAEVEPLPAR
jgi:hypothetical protein